MPLKQQPQQPIKPPARQAKPAPSGPDPDRLRKGGLVPGPTARDVLQLQRSAGNRAVNRILAKQPRPDPVQRKENNTGLPDSLKAGIENLSGISMDEVKVHYNSSRPAGHRALAYTQGGDIHVGPGQEQHLSHEAWHAVQQMQGRVAPTARSGQAAVNDDRGLEKEADVMGAKAARQGQTPGTRDVEMKAGRPSGQVVQMITEDDPAADYIEMDHWGHKHLQNDGDRIYTDSMSTCVTIAISNGNNDAIIAHFGSSLSGGNPLVDVKNGLTAIKNKMDAVGGQWSGYVFKGVKSHPISEKRIKMITTKLPFIVEGETNSGVTLTLQNNTIKVTWVPPRKIPMDLMGY